MVLQCVLGDCVITEFCTHVDVHIYTHVYAHVYMSLHLSVHLETGTCRRTG